MAQNTGNGKITLTGEIMNTRRTRQNIESVYTGKIGRHFWMILGTSLLSIIPIFGLPNAIVIRKRWDCEHTYVTGMKLQFEGKAMKLLGRFFVWGFFSVITLGLYAMFYLPVRYKQWMAENTIFAPIA